MLIDRPTPFAVAGTARGGSGRAAMPERRPSGFTLLELLIAMVVLAIVTAVAMPMFQDSVRKSRRADAMAALTQVMQAQERFRANNAGYYQGLLSGLAGAPTNGPVGQRPLCADHRRRFGHRTGLHRGGHGQFLVAAGRRQPVPGDAGHDCRRQPAGLPLVRRWRIAEHAARPMLGSLMQAAGLRRRGFTLVELMLSLGVLSVLVALAVPSMANYIQRKRVDSAANELVTSLRYARSLAPQTNNAIWISFGTSGTFTCYAVHSVPGAASCQCTNWPDATCGTSPLNTVQPVAYKTAILPSDLGVSVAATASELIFLPSGMPDELATISVNLTSSRGGALRVTTNGTGLPAICSVSGHPTYPACP